MLSYLFKIFDVPSEKCIIRPPGSPDETEFILTCRRCGKCALACEYDTIKLSMSESGTAIGTPFLSLRRSYCRMCMKCIGACEHGVLKKTDDRIKIGIAMIDERSCLAWTGRICMTCYSNCHVGAIELDSELRPKVNEKCTGCGRCETMCVKYPSIKIKKEANSIW